MTAPKPAVPVSLYSRDALTADALRRIVRDLGFSLVRHVPVRSIVLVVSRSGHARMASWVAPTLSRLDVGLAESRAYRAWTDHRNESEPTVVTHMLPGSAITAMVRFELPRPPDDYTRSMLGLASLRLAAPVRAAESLELGDAPLHVDSPAVVLVDESGQVHRANSVFEDLSMGASSLDELGTTQTDGALLRRLLDDALLNAGESSTAVVRIGPTARLAAVRCASPLAGVVIAVISEHLPTRVDVLRKPSAVATVTLERTTLRALDGNDRGRALMGDRSLVEHLAPEDRLSLVHATVAVGPDPKWLGPFRWNDGTRVELVAATTMHSTIPAIATLIAT